MDNIYMHLDNFVNVMETYGEISDDEFDRCQIGMDEKRKDHLVWYQRRSCILTNREFIAAERLKRHQERVADLAAIAKREQSKRRLEDKANEKLKREKLIEIDKENLYNGRFTLTLQSTPLKIT